MKLRFLLSGTALVLAACGGGGATGPALTLEDLQGFWSGSVSGPGLGADKVRAVVLDDGSAWLFLHDASTAGEPLVGLAKVALSASGESFSGSGKRYLLSGNGVGSNMSVAGSVPAANTLAVTTSGAAGIASAPDLSYDNRYETAAQQADAVGSWRFTKEGGSIQWAWSIAADGTLSGSSTSGCTYSGRVVPNAKPVAVYDVTMTEACTNGSATLAGIARLNTDKTFLTFGVTTTDGAQADAFAAQKAALN